MGWLFVFRIPQVTYAHITSVEVASILRPAIFCHAHSPLQSPSIRRVFQSCNGVVAQTMPLGTGPCPSNPLPLKSTAAVDPS